MKFIFMLKMNRYVRGYENFQCDMRTNFFNYLCSKLESLHTLDVPHHGCRVCKVLTLLQFQAVWAHFSDQKSV